MRRGELVVLSEVTGEVPHQVSPWPGRFVNREHELTIVSALVGDQGRAGTRIAVFTGLPGVGKTVLVRKAVERHRGAFPGGELFVEFRQTDDGGFSVGDALASCLLALGVSASVLPASQADRVGLFRTRTASRPTLVVLDGVADPAQVTPLVPSAPGSVVLVTSTARLTELRLDGAEIVDVAPLDDVAGAQLLRELCGSRVDAEPEALRTLVAVCGGLPVSLRAAAGRLVRRSGLTVADLVDDIAAEQGRGASTTEMALFSLIYHQLPEDVASLYRVFGVLPGASVELGLVAAAHGVTERVVARLLEDLVEAGLVDEPAPGRYGLHVQVRRHAAERAFAEDTDAERDAALRRAMEALLRQAAFADRAVLGAGRYRCTPHERLLAGHDDPFPEPGRRHAALRWLDAERGTLAAGVRACAERGWHELTWQLAESATALYVVRRYLTDWTETSETGARAAGLAGHGAAEARLRSFVSRPWTELGDHARARRELDRAFALAADVSAPGMSATGVSATGVSGADASGVRLLASIHEMDARLHDAQGAPSAAVAAFGRAIELFRGVADLRGEAFVAAFAGAARLRAGEPHAALDELTAALELIRQVGDPRMAGRTMISAARAAVAVGDVRGARTWLEDAIAVLGGSDDAFYEAEAQQVLADVLAADGAAGAARECLLRARDLHLRLGGAQVDELERRLIALDQG